MTSRKHEGFKVEKRTAIVEFAEDSPWHGVEAKVITSIPFKTLLWFQQNAGSSASVQEAVRVFAESFLTEWNLLDEEGKPYPPTVEGVDQVPDYDLVTQLMAGWIEAVTNPPTSSSAKSNGSALLEEPLMEKLAKSSVPLGN